MQFHRGARHHKAICSQQLSVSVAAGVVVAVGVSVSVSVGVSVSVAVAVAVDAGAGVPVAAPVSVAGGAVRAVAFFCARPVTVAPAAADCHARKEATLSTGLWLWL